MFSKIVGTLRVTIRRDVACVVDAGELSAASTAPVDGGVTRRGHPRRGKELDNCGIYRSVGCMAALLDTRAA